VQLEMAHFAAQALCHADGRAHLVADHVLQLVFGQGHPPATKILQIGKPRMRANSHIAVDGMAHGGSHHIRIACVKTTGDVG